jgi:diguanylate cyclase (GGDEF)-like protein
LKGRTELIKKLKSTSIKRKFFFPWSLSILAVSIIYTLSLIIFGFLTSLNESANNALYYTVKNRTEELSSKMRFVAAKTSETAYKVNEMFSEELKKSINDTGYKNRASITEEALRNVLPTLIETTKRIEVSGVFLVINSSEYGSNLHRSGVKIKDNQPGIITNSNADLKYSRGPTYLLTDVNLPMDDAWSYEYLIGKEPISYDDKTNTDFFWKPMLATKSFYYRLQEAKGYWSRPYKAAEGEERVVSYSVPLLDEDGKLYGVFGIDLSVDYITKMIPAKEINYKSSFYLVSGFDINEKKLDTSWYIESGLSASRFLPAFKGNTLLKDQNESEKYGIYSIETKDKNYKTLYAKPEKIDLYDSNSLFYNEAWYLTGFAPKEEMMSYYKSMVYSILLSLLATIVLGMMILTFISAKVTTPIIDMSIKVKNHDFNKPILLKKIGITEIDNLASALESSTNEVLTSSARLELTIDLVGAEIGSFEYDVEAERVYLTDSLFKLLEIEKTKGKNYISSSLWKNIIRDTFDVSEVEYTSPKTKKIRWLRMKSAFVNEKVLGILVDITREVDERKRVELERDLDMITGLYNRGAFQTLVKAKLETEAFRIGALIFLDLDNLKYINDVYGHDVGDKYIKCAADNLRKFHAKNAVTSRISGDEFAIYIQGDKSRELLMKEIQGVIDSFDSILRLPDNSAHKVRASIGVAFYPEDADNVTDLIKYADFAMYEIKHSFKGRIKEFDKKSYDKNYYLFDKKEALNNLIENKLIYFVYQPIVDAVNGEIIAYEALMRSKSKDFNTPFEILTLAKSQAKLYEIEKLTIFGVLEQYVLLKESFKERKVFLNSIPNQSLSEEDLKNIEINYKKYLSSFVVELTEEEKIMKRNKEPMLNLFLDNGSKVAIDDFGAGYSNEIALITTVPNYIKLDMLLVRDIERNQHKQKLVSNIISYAKENSIKTIAEGVETFDEMKTLILLGTDYLQGFYLGKPNEKVSHIPTRIKEEIKSINF